MSHKSHKEKLNDEVFVGNIRVGSDLSHLNGVEYRIGDQAFDIDGKKLPRDYMRPLFVKRRDYATYDRIMMERLRDARYPRRPAGTSWVVAPGGAMGGPIAVDATRKARAGGGRA